MIAGSQNNSASRDIANTEILGTMGAEDLNRRARLLGRLRKVNPQSRSYL